MILNNVRFAFEYFSEGNMRNTCMHTSHKWKHLWLHYKKNNISGKTWLKKKIDHIEHKGGLGRSFSPEKTCAEI